MILSKYHMDAFLKIHKFDKLCLSKTLLGLTVPINDGNIFIDWYPLLEVDHPNDVKRGGVCMYFKEYLSLIKINDLTNRKECSVTEVNEKNEKQFCTDFDRIFSSIDIII